MSENNRNPQDLDEILENIETIDEVKEVKYLYLKVSNLKVLLKTTIRMFLNFLIQLNLKTMMENIQLLDLQQVIDSNISCGGNIKVKGQIKGNVTVNGSADIYGTIEGDIQANDVTLENGAKY